MRKLNAIVICTTLLTAASGAVLADGASTYKEVCSSCHESGAADAPKLEDKAEWGHRIAQGTDALYKSTINGKCDVFVKHLRTDLSEETIKTAVDYMISRAR